nr:prephenate dehydrogenase [Streptomyces sp. SID4917]
MAVVGTGLIGTSVALAAGRHGVKVHLMDRDESAVRAAVALGAGASGVPAGPVDLAVLAVPPNAVGAVLAEQQARGLAHSYTDVASVKHTVDRQVLHEAADPSCFVGGHPLAGRERSGPLAARANLFEDRSWVLTPSNVTSRTTLNRTLELIALCGAVPLIMDSRDHDDVVALVSHAPHAVASLMAARLRHAPKEAARLAGQGVRDVTRVAAGDALLWADILGANAAPVAAVLRELREDLSVLLAALDRLAVAPPDGDRQIAKEMVDLLDQGVAGLAEIQGRHDGESPARTRVWVTLDGRPGELARLLTALTEFGVRADDVTVRPLTDSGKPGLSVEFAASAAANETLISGLVASGWHAESARPARRAPGKAEALA